MASLTDVIVKNPDILSRTPVFRGMRVPLQALFDSIESGETLETAVPRLWEQGAVTSKSAVTRYGRYGENSGDLAHAEPHFRTWFHYLPCPSSYDFSLLHSNGGSFYGAASRKAKLERRARADPAVCEKF